MAKNRFQSDTLQKTYEKFVGNDPKWRAEFEEQHEETLVQIDAARLIYEMRSAAGLSQRALAAKVGTSASAINRLESADYEGHTLAMLRRVAAALGRRLELRAVLVKRKRKAA